MTKNHIGALPASALIFCCRIFYLLTYSPRGPEYGGSASMTAFLAVPQACPNCSTGRAGCLPLSVSWQSCWCSPVRRSAL